MNLNDQDKQEFISSIWRTYGIQLSKNDELFPVIYAMMDTYRTTGYDLSSVRQKMDKIETALNYLPSNISKEHIHLNDTAAFWWNVGLAVRYLIIVLILLLVGWTWFFFTDTFQLKKQAEAVIANSAMFDPSLLKNIKVNEKGYLILEAHKVKGDNINFFSEYLEVGKGTIWIFLGAPVK